MWLALVVFTSGIVDEGPPWWWSCLSTARVLLVGVWVWNLVRSLVGVGLAHCWVLKDQAPPLVGER